MGPGFGGGFGGGGSYGSVGGYGGSVFGGGSFGSQQPVYPSTAPLSASEYEAAAAALINTPGMKKAESVGLQLTDEAVQALLKIPATYASELLEGVSDKVGTLRDPSNYVISTVAKGYVPKGR
jgi:hypothetical protein